MRLVMVSRAPPALCGIAEYASMLVEALRGLGVEASFVSTVVLGEGRYTEPYSGVEVVECFREEGPVYSGVVRCVEELGLDDDTVVHIQHDYSIFRSDEGFLELLRGLRGLVDRAGSALVVTMHTVSHPIAYPERPRLQRLVAGTAHAVVVHSRLMEYELIVEGAPAGRIRLIPHGTPLNPFLGRRREHLLERLGLDPGLAGYRLVTTPGFIRPNKGFEFLLEAFRLLRRRVPDARLILAGVPQRNPAYFEEVRRLAESVGGVVVLERFLRRDEMNALLAAVDAAVFPYRVEPFYSVSGALHTAMGSGLASACTRVAKLVECNEALPQLSVEAGDARGLAAALARLLLDAEEARKASETMRRMGEETSWARTAERHLRLYEALLSGEEGLEPPPDSLGDLHGARAAS